MFEFIHDDDRGQVGIGTLIVFIAMVLVAAIAAGVLINTAGFLQTQAEATGEESASQVSDRIEVQSATGEVAFIEDTGTDEFQLTGDDTSENIEEGPLLYQVDLTVTKAPGADTIDLEDVTAEMITDSGVEQVVLEEEIGAPDDADNDQPVSIAPITAETEDDVVITDNGDRYTVSFYGYEGDGPHFSNLDGDVDVLDDAEDRDAAWIGDLEGSDTMEVRLTTASGATTVEEVRVPDSLVDRDTVAL